MLLFTALGFGWGWVTRAIYEKEKKGDKMYKEETYYYYLLNELINKIRAEIDSPNRGTCDFFIVDRIEELIDDYQKRISE